MTCNLSLLTFKTTFLLAVIFAHRASELCALHHDPLYLQFFKDKVIMYPDTAFLLKVISHYHLSQPIVLPTFIPITFSPLERDLHTLDVHRALAFIPRGLLCSFPLQGCLFVTQLRGHGFQLNLSPLDKGKRKGSP